MNKNINEYIRNISFIKDDGKCIKLYYHKVNNLEKIIEICNDKIEYFLVKDYLKFSKK